MPVVLDSSDKGNTVDAQNKDDKDHGNNSRLGSPSRSPRRGLARRSVSCTRDNDGYGSSSTMRMKGYESYSRHGGGRSGDDEASSPREGGVGGEGPLDGDPHPHVDDEQEGKEEDRDGGDGDWRSDDLPERSLDADRGREYADVDGDEEGEDDAARWRQQHHHHQDLMIMGNGGGSWEEDNERGKRESRVSEDDHEGACGNDLPHYRRQMYDENFAEQDEGRHKEEDLHPTPTGLKQNSGEDDQRRYDDDYSHYYENGQDEGVHGKQEEQRKERQCQEQSTRHLPNNKAWTGRFDDHGGGDGDDGDDDGGSGDARVGSSVRHVDGDVGEEDNNEVDGLCDTDSTGKGMKSNLPLHDKDDGACGRPLTGSFSERDVDEGNSRASFVAETTQRSDANEKKQAKQQGHEEMEQLRDEGSDAGESCEEEEGRAQQCKRRQLRDYLMSRVPASIDTIEASYVRAYRAIRDIVNEQNAELENEKELGNSLLEFGVRVREATELMQRQMSSFYNDEPTSVEPATPALRHGNRHATSMALASRPQMLDGRVSNVGNSVSQNGNDFCRAGATPGGGGSRGGDTTRNRNGGIGKDNKTRKEGGEEAGAVSGKRPSLFGGRSSSHTSCPESVGISACSSDGQQQLQDSRAIDGKDERGLSSLSTPAFSFSRHTQQQLEGENDDHGSENGHETLEGSEESGGAPGEAGGEDEDMVHRWRVPRRSENGDKRNDDGVMGRDAEMPPPQGSSAPLPSMERSLRTNSNGSTRDGPNDRVMGDGDTTTPWCGGLSGQSDEGDSGGVGGGRPVAKRPRWKQQTEPFLAATSARSTNELASCVT